MAKPTISTDPAGVTLPSNQLEWQNFTVIGTGFAGTTKVTPKKSNLAYYLDYTIVIDATGQPRDDILILSVTRQKKHARTRRRTANAAVSVGDTDSLDYTVTNSVESDEATVVIVYD
jgi:hypothetical protein